MRVSPRLSIPRTLSTSAPTSSRSAARAPGDTAGGEGGGPDGQVRVPDLLKLLGCWGTITPQSDPACACLDTFSQDGTEVPDGQIRVKDLIPLLGHWGICP